MTNYDPGQCVTMMNAVELNTVLVSLIFYMYRLTGSTAILVGALESAVNIFPSGFAL